MVSLYNRFPPFPRLGAQCALCTQDHVASKYGHICQSIFIFLSMFALAKKEAEYLETPLRNSLAGLVTLSKTSRECCAEGRRKKRQEIIIIFLGYESREDKKPSCGL